MMSVSTTPEWNITDVLHVCKDIYIYIKIALEETGAWIVEDIPTGYKYRGISIVIQNRVKVWKDFKSQIV